MNTCKIVDFFNIFYINQYIHFHKKWYNLVKKKYSYKKLSLWRDRP